MSAVTVTERPSGEKPPASTNLPPSGVIVRAFCRLGTPLLTTKSASMSCQTPQGVSLAAGETRCDQSSFLPSGEKVAPRTPSGLLAVVLVSLNQRPPSGVTA